MTSSPPWSICRAAPVLSCLMALPVMGHARSQGLQDVLEDYWTARLPDIPDDRSDLGETIVPGLGQ